MEPLTDAQLAAFWPMVTPEAIYNAMPRETKERLVRQVILRWAFEAQIEDAYADDDDDFDDFDDEPEERVEEKDTDFTDDEDEDEDADVENRPFYI
jgi:hypothetical protein